MIPGATPKVTMSANESNCLPNSLCTFNSLATNPSRKSNIAEAKMQIGAISILPVSVKIIANIPPTRLPAVSKLGINRRIGDDILQK